jgi:hypothetical protein
MPQILQRHGGNVFIPEPRGSPLQPVRFYGYVAEEKSSAQPARTSSFRFSADFSARSCAKQAARIQAPLDVISWRAASAMGDQIMRADERHARVKAGHSGAAYGNLIIVVDRMLDRHGTNPLLATKTRRGCSSRAPAPRRGCAIAI